MSSKEEYESAKAARKAERDAMIAKAQKNETDEKEILTSAFDMLDRFVTAVERIADGLERK